MGKIRSRYTRIYDELGLPVRQMDSPESDEADGISGDLPLNSSLQDAIRPSNFWKGAAVLVVAALLCYSNVGFCDLVFDDISAIKDNKDLRPTQPLTNLIFNDFWGTPMSKENSHKSYRPFTVLTFRWNYAFGGIEPFGYHLANAFLHAFNSVLVFKLYTTVVPFSGALVGALLFAVHPIHTEAVTGVVGRAELLSTMFAILLFLLCANCPTRGWKRNLVSPVLLFLALFSKEQGITVVAVCVVYEIFCRQQLVWTEVVQAFRSLFREKSKFHPVFGRALGRLWALVLATIFLLLWRLRIMKGQLPVFTAFDNPASTSQLPAKQLTYMYLLPLNAWLLIFPHFLLCDYTMGTVPLVQSFLDLRNLATLLFLIIFAKISYRAVSSKCPDERCALMMSVSWIVFPFLPASNLLFPVGFVVAERILYMPSIGFCLLIGHGYRNVIRYADSLKHVSGSLERFFNCALFICLIAFGIRSHVRNSDWRSENSLFRSGLKITQSNAKIFNNIGHVLEKEKNFPEALKFFQSATKSQPDDVGAWNNVGRTFNSLNRSAEAEAAWRTAKDLLPQPTKGHYYQARIAPQHLNVFLNLGTIMARNPARLEEADQILRQAISMRSDFADAYINRGDVLLKMNRTAEAADVYKKALEINADNPDVYYNLAIVYTEMQQPETALEYFNKALAIKPDHELALLNSAVLMAETKKTSFYDTIEQRLATVLEKDENPNAFFQMGLLMMDRNDPTAAEGHFRKTIELKNDHKSALFNIALLLHNRKRPAEALPYLLSLVNYYPNHIKGWILIGDIYINFFKNYTEAEKAYRQVLLVEPENFQAFHNFCVTLVEQSRLEEADRCMGDLAQLMKNDADYLATHFKTIFDRLHRRKLAAENGSVPVFK